MNDKEINIKSPDEVTLDERSYEPEPAPASQPINPEPSSEPAQTPELPDQNSSISQQDIISTPNPEEPPKESHKSRNIFIAVIALIFVTLGTATTVAIINHNNQPAEESPKNSEKPIEKQEPISELKLTGNSLSDFDLEFLKLENEAKNKIYSPLSIKYALAMLKDGAAGESKTQIENLIGDYVPKAYLNSENRSLANAIAINETYKDAILPNYVDLLQSKYYAETIYDPFANATAVNQWVSDKTLGRINNLLQDDFNRDNDKMFLLINALAIDMEWNYKIQCSDTVSNVKCKSENANMSYRREKFDEPKISRIHDNKYESMVFDDKDNAKSVNFAATVNNYDIKNEIGDEKIRETIKKEYAKWLQSESVTNWVAQQGWDGIEQDAEKYLASSNYLEELYSNYGKFGSSTDFYLYDDDSVKAFAKDLKEYDGDTLQYVAIMPKSTDLKTYTSSLTAEKASNIINGLKDIKSEEFKQGVVTKITGRIPLFDFSYDLKLKDDLLALGVKKAFDGNGGELSGITTREDAFIQNAIHKANIEFSNEGIKAAAVTVLIGGLGATGGPSFEYDWEVPVEEIDLTFDKPFIFLIRDKATGEVWFTGAVYEPLLNN